MYLTVIAGLAMTTPCLAGDELVDILNRISHELASLEYSDTNGNHRYEFSLDPDYPCSSSLLYRNQFEGIRWIRQYHFELSDLEPGQFLVSKDRRRAISYYGERTSSGETKKFPPKKITTIRLHMPTDSQLPDLFAEAIRLCEVRNTFPE